MRIKDFILSNDRKTLLRYVGSEKNIIIPNVVTRIGTYAFYNYSSLKSIEIPNSVTSIGNGAFYRCSSLIRSGKFKVFNIRKNELYCLDKKYEENKWHYVKGELWLGGNGIHYVDNLYEIFDYYCGKIDKDIAIYEIETRGGDIKDKYSSRHCCRSIRLKRRIYREELIKMLSCIKEEE